MQALLATGISFIALDAAWLTYRYNYHNKLFTSIQKSNLSVRIVPAILIYVVLAYALYIWAIKDQKTLESAATKGALVGFILYGFYDLTNYATLTNWTLEMLTVDIMWGTFASTIAAAIGFYFLKKQ